jgi:hypothetical protein
MLHRELLILQSLTSTLFCAPIAPNALNATLSRQDPVNVAHRLGFAQKVLNPTHGSGWFGSGPFDTAVPEPPSNPTHGSGWILQWLRPKDLKHPPTAVGGIPIALWVFI